MKSFLFRLALLAYPRAFRRHFGAEMRADFECSTSGSGTAAALMQLCASGLAERGAAVSRALFWPAHQPHLYAPSGRHHMFWDTMRSDLQHTLRLARRTPVYTALAVVALALGIGATTTVFTLVNGVLLRDLPYQDPERLVMVWSNNGNEQRDRNVVSPANFLDFQRLSHTVDSMDYVLSFLISLTINGDENGTRVATLRTGPQIFQVLGRSAALGRVYGPGDRDVAVVSHGFWTRMLGADPAAIGRRLTFSGNETLEIIGVMPPDFVFPYSSMFDQWASGNLHTADLWVPMPFEGPRWTSSSGELTRVVHSLAVVGRLREGVSVDEAQADLGTVADQLAQAYPASNTNWGVTVVPLMEQTVGSVRTAMLMLLAGVGVILLMAVVNVANMVLARSLARQRERAVRSALGASRRRLLQQAVTEGLVLSLLGGAVGVLWSYWGVRALVAMAPADIPRLQEVIPDQRVLWFCILVSVIAGTLVGIIPAISGGSRDARGALNERSRGATTSASGRRMRDGLLVTEVALAVMLTVLGSLLVHSFVRVMGVDTGFSHSSLLTFQINVPDRLTTPATRRAFYEEFMDRLKGLPGVMAAGGTTRIPLGSSSVTTSVQVEGQPLGGQLPEAEFRRALGDYFNAMNIPVLRGRAFRPDDGVSGEPVVIVNQALSRRLFGDSDPVGRRLRTGPSQDGPWMTIIGVIGDIRHSALDVEPLPELYVNYASNPPVSPFFAVRTTSDPAALAGRVREQLRAVDRTAVAYDIRPMADVRAASVADRRFIMFIVVACTALALLLAGVGVYGVVTVAVTQRIPEMGVRLALGANPATVATMVIADTVRLAGVGAAIGIGAALLATPLIRSELYGITANDPLSLAISPAVLLLVAILAALVPARRAMTVDPLSALRAD